MVIGEGLGTERPVDSEGVFSSGECARRDVKSLGDEVCGAEGVFVHYSVVAVESDGDDADREGFSVGSLIDTRVGDAEEHAVVGDEREGKSDADGVANWIVHSETETFLTILR